MTRVLMGDFSALHRLGFEEILRGDGIELVETGDADVVDRLVEALPDVIVLDLDQRGVLDLVHPSCTSSRRSRWSPARRRSR